MGAAAGIAPANGSAGRIGKRQRDLYYRRAEREIERACAATVASVATAHYQLACQYLDRVYGAEGDPRAMLRREDRPQLSA